MGVLYMQVNAPSALDVLHPPVHLALQQCTSDAVSPPVVEAALDAALRQLQPHAASNPGGFEAITEHVRALKGLLKGGST